MADLFAPACSIAPTRRRRFLWAAWWTGPPVAEPFRPPDAFEGGARTREEALAAAERAAGASLVELHPRWALAWSRIVLGQPPWPRRGRAAGGDPGAALAARSRPAPESIWAVLGLAPGASLDEIRSAHRHRARQTHPDHGGDAEAFRQVQQAYEEAVRRTERRARRPAGPSRRR